MQLWFHKFSREDELEPDTEIPQGKLVKWVTAGRQ